MQGIDHLDFRPDKFGNQDIVGMVSAEDEVVPALNKLIIGGIPDKKDLWPDALSEYHRHRDHLSTIGPVVLYKGRAVLPASLRKKRWRCSTRLTKESPAWSAEQDQLCSGPACRKTSSGPDKPAHPVTRTFPHSPLPHPNHSHNPHIPLR